MTAGTVYEYYATAVVAGQETDPSNEVQVSWAGNSNTSSGIIARTRTNNKGNIEVDVVAPSSKELEDANPYLTDDYGETRTYEMPVDFEYDTQDPDADYASYDPDEVEALGLEIAQAQMAANQGHRRIQITPVVPILGLQRGAVILSPGSPGRPQEVGS